MVSFDTVSVPPPVEDPDEKKEVHFSPHHQLLIIFIIVVVIFGQLGFLSYVIIMQFLELNVKEDTTLSKW